ncbi:MAG TPA: dTMP kinase [Blastocatellia bacterium]|nr:dTMP kinase [Blastocatellia bacterium]
MRGPFITFEGIDGCGKSTQFRILGRALTGKGLNPVSTREPGGTAVGEQLRPLLLSQSEISLAPLTELFLLAAARAQNVAQVILPGIEAGQIVLSDRYIDSSVAFQGYGRGLDLATVDDVNRIATGGLLPDLTIVYDLAVDLALARVNARYPSQGSAGATIEADRFHDEDRDFHESVRRGYLELARRNPDRITVIDASPSVTQVRDVTLDLVEPLIARVLQNQSR